MRPSLPLAAVCEPLHLLLDGLPLPQSDLLLPVSVLLDSSGKALQKKRAQLRSFATACPNWAALPLAGATLDVAFGLERQWQTDPGDAEQAYLRRCFRSYGELGLCGVLLTDGRQPVGYSIAALCEEGAYLLAQRALPLPAGSVAVLYRETAQLLVARQPTLQYVNLGWMGGPTANRLRLSYHPLRASQMDGRG